MSKQSRHERREARKREARERYERNQAERYEQETQPSQVVKQRMSTGHKWTLALVVVLVLVLVAPRACRWIEEASCTADGGRVIVHNFSGRKACDKPPFADNISDLGSNDYWLE